MSIIEKLVKQKHNQTIGVRRGQVKIIYIKWFDASYNEGRQKIEQMDSDYILEEAGIYVKEDKKCITFATQYTAKDKIYQHIHHIPKVNIIKKRIIKI